jgi:hypothetical protein
MTPEEQEKVLVHILEGGVVVLTVEETQQQLTMTGVSRTRYPHYMVSQGPITSLSGNGLKDIPFEKLQFFKPGIVEETNLKDS